MPTILTHAVVPLSVGLGLGKKVIPRRLMLLGMLAAMLPDMDVVAFKLGIAYADGFGHRGASHSVLFSLLLGLLALALPMRWPVARLRVFGFVALATLSHPLLDMFTNGGLGVALFWPWSMDRFFAPWQVIEVSPIALKRVFSERGLAVLRSEALWVWTPSLLTCLSLRWLRWRRDGRRVETIA